MTQTGNAAITAPETVTEFVTEQLRDRIVLGLLKPGEKLSVYTLAEELGVSRVPLREAVRQLEAESLVDNVARRGTVVRRLSATDVNDAFEMLQRVELLAAERAATHGNQGTAQEMRHWLDRMGELVASDTPRTSPDMLHAHRAFHFALFKGSGETGVLYRHLCMLWNTAERYVVNSRDAERVRQSHREHEEITKQIESGDAEGAASVLHKHITAAYSNTVQFLESQGIEVGHAERTVL
jgi:DNA-binding GntR family transcriptional regulator